MRYATVVGWGFLALAAIDTASAADMAIKAPAPAAPSAYDWTGFYVGGNIGYGVAGDPSGENFITQVGTPFSDESFTLSPGGAVGGAQMGANFQTGKWIFGAEGDWQWSGQNNSVCVQSCSVNLGGLNAQLTVDERIAWLATMRGRLGYADGAFLWYATAGGAWARVDTNYVSTTVPASFDRTLGGWAIGGGIEAAVTGNWTAKFEYLYIGLAAVNDTFIGPFNGSQSIHSDIRENIVRVGLNYRFGAANGTVPPLLAATTSSSNWSGAYVGAHGGYGIGPYSGHETLTPNQTAQTFAQAPDGGLLGAQAGYNWQNGHWVSGVEGDWQWANQRDSISITLGGPGKNINNDGLALSDTLHWLATLRGRLGYSSGDWLWYVTGGGAFAGAEEADTLTFGGVTAAANFNRTLGGWTAGAGVEKVISGNWSAKLEYLYVSLGSVTDSFALAPGQVETVRQNVTDNVMRLGLNYRF